MKPSNFFLPFSLCLPWAFFLCLHNADSQFPPGSFLDCIIVQVHSLHTTGELAPLITMPSHCPATQFVGCCAHHWTVGTISFYFLDLKIVQLHKVLGVVHATGELAHFFPDKETWTLSSCTVCWMLCIVHITRQLAQFFVTFFPDPVIVQLHSLVGVVHTTRQLDSSL